MGLGLNTGLAQTTSRDPKRLCSSQNPFSYGWNGSSGGDCLGDYVKENVRNGLLRSGGITKCYKSGPVADVIEDSVSRRRYAGRDSSGTGRIKYNLQFFGGNGKYGKTQLSFDEALYKLERSNLQPGQTVISRGRVLKIGKSYNPIKASRE